MPETVTSQPSCSGRVLTTTPIGFLSSLRSCSLARHANECSRISARDMSPPVPLALDPRGRIELAATMRRGLEHRGVFAYRFDQHTIDTQRNRYLNETLRLIAYRIGARHAIDGASLTAREAASLARTLTECGVAATPTTGYRAESEVFGQHDRGDARVMQLAQLFRSLRIPSQADGAMRIDELERDETALRKTFERAMYGVLRHALESGWAVKHGGRLAWPVERATIGAATIVPRMEIDIRVDNHTTGARTIIDTKYTSITHRGQFDRERLRSSHIYQVYAYIRSQESVNDVPSLSAAGVLLHPSVGVDVDESVWMHGHRFRFVTVDLASDVRTLRAQVLRAVEHEVLPNRTHS